MNDLIVVKQLPIIEERLRQVKQSVKARVAEALQMPCTEETRKAVKDARAQLRREFSELEARRKAVKSEVLAPYEAFESIYKECVSDMFLGADATLKGRIDAVESEIKETRAAEIESYFDEVCEGLSIPEGFVSLERAGIKINLSSSVASLKKQAVSFLERVHGELQYISALENSEEILLEYKRTLNVVQAMTTVTERHKAIEAEKQRRQTQQAELETRVKAQQQTEAAVQEEDEKTQTMLQPPTAEPVQDEETEEKQYVTAFRVTGTMGQLKALKAFLNSGGYKYESI